MCPVPRAEQLEPTEPPALSPRRREILEAAVQVLGSLGWRGLTHRAIDREAGLPLGSSSAYYRSRAALQTALADHVVRRLAAEAEQAAVAVGERPGDHEHAVAVTGELFRRWLRDPSLLTARLELTLAGTRDEALAGQLEQARRGLTAIVEGALAVHGTRPDAPDGVAEVVVAALDGVLIAALLRPAPERTEFVAHSLDVLFGTLIED